MRKLNTKKGTVAVIGMGYVGLPLGIAFARAGLSVIGIDINPRKISALQRGVTEVEDVQKGELKSLIAKKSIKFSNDYSAVSKCNAVIICVPTPLNKLREPDVSHVIDSVEKISCHLKKGHLIVLESTTYPGTTSEVVLPILENSNLKCGRDFFLCFSPERIDPGNPVYGPSNIPKVVGGITKKCTQLGKHLYENVTDQVVCVSGATTAEMSKLIENTFRVVNIGLVNELAVVSEKMGIDIWEAIDAASTKPFGYMPFYPGPGIGGHCIGVDPIYLSWKAKVHGQEIRFINLASQMNTEMPIHIVSRIGQYLNDEGKSIRKAKILLLGMSYKKNISDVRESPGIYIYENLEQLGAKIDFYDPHVRQLVLSNKIRKSLSSKRVSYSAYDIVILLANHCTFNYKKIAKDAKLIFDTRNEFKKQRIISKKIKTL